MTKGHFFYPPIGEVRTGGHTAFTIVKVTRRKVDMVSPKQSTWGVRPVGGGESDTVGPKNRKIMQF